MKYRYILDSVLTLVDDTEAMGWNDFTDRLLRDSERNGITLQREEDITFYGEGHDYIRNKYLTEGYCDLITCDIQEFNTKTNTWENTFNGTIKVPDVSFNLKKKTCKVKLQDNSYFARIDNNKNIADYLFGGKSKNGVDIPPAEFYRITVFDPRDGTLYPPQDTHGLNGFRVYEVFRYLIEYMSDGEVGFVSNDFGVGGEWEGLAIMNGYTLAFGKAVTFDQDEYEDNSIKIFFEEFFKEVHKNVNIAWKMEEVAGQPVMRIDKAVTLFTGQNKKVTFKNIDEIIEKTDAKELYSVLKIGSEHINESQMDASTLSFPSNADFIGFKKEDWTLAGTCNVDRPFDLQGEYITDSNIIQDILGFNTAGLINRDYDDRWVFLETTYQTTNTGDAVLGDVFGSTPPYSYNPSLRNSEVIANFQDYIPNSIVQHLSQNTGGTFSAFKTDNVNIPYGTNISQQIIATTEITDDGGNYDNVTGDYVIPFNGLFAFQTKDVVWDTFGGNGILRLIIRRFDNTGVTLLGEISKQWGFGQAFPALGVKGMSAAFVANSNDIIRFFIEGGLTANFPNQPPFVTWRKRTFIECTAVQGAGGIYSGHNPDNYRAILHQFEYPLSREEYKEILSNPTDSYEFYMHGHSPQWGFIDRIRYRRATGNAQVVLLSNLNTNR